MFKFLPNKKTFFKFLSKRLETVDLSMNDIKDILDECLSITHNRFKFINNKYYKNDKNEILLQTAHGSQMILFLYELSRQAYIQSLTNDKEENDKYKVIADKLYYLKIADTSTNILYSIDLPLKIFCDHPHSSVIGRATFTEKSSFKFSTCCSIGNNWGNYPSVDGDLVMFPNSVLLGNIKIEGIVVLSNGCYIKDEGVIKDKIVFGRSPNLIFKSIKKEDKQKYIFYI
jgi:hypothetical protein